MVWEIYTIPTLIYSRGAFKPPAPLQLEAFRPKALRFAWGSAQSDEYKRGRSLINFGSLPVPRFYKFFYRYIPSHGPEEYLF